MASVPATGKGERRAWKPKSMSRLAIPGADVRGVFDWAVTMMHSLMAVRFAPEHGVVGTSRRNGSWR